MKERALPAQCGPVFLEPAFAKNARPVAWPLMDAVRAMILPAIFAAHAGASPGWANDAKKVDLGHAAGTADCAGVRNSPARAHTKHPRIRQPRPF